MVYVGQTSGGDDETDEQMLARRLRALADRAAGWVPAVAPVDEFGGDQ